MIYKNVFIIHDSYFICYDGVPKPFKCADNIHWNQKIQECDLPENAYCQVKKN